MAKQDEVKLTCSFCGKSQHEVRKLIAGPTIYICDECIKLCNDILAEKAPRTDHPADETAPPSKKPEGAKESGRMLLCCSFCGKSQREVKGLIAGPSSYICDECIGLCNDIIAEEIDREEHAFVLKAKLPGGVRALLAGILERGLPAVVRIQQVFSDRIREETVRRRAAGEPLDKLLWLPWDLAVQWRDLHDALRRAAPERSESGEERSLEAELSGWMTPITERLTGTLEALDLLARSLEKPGVEELRRLGPSVDVAAEKLREAREMLLAAPVPATPAPQD